MNIVRKFYSVYKRETDFKMGKQQSKLTKYGGNIALKPKGQAFNDKSKSTDVRLSNIQAAKAVSDAIRTSLGPRGIDKMIQAGKGGVFINNGGATIVKQINVLHPAAEMWVELCRAQDVEAGNHLCGSYCRCSLGSLWKTLAERHPFYCYFRFIPTLC